MEEKWLGKNMIWWKGVIEDRKDPLHLGRCKVRIFGWHSERKEDMPTENLPWALPSLPINTDRDHVGIREADWVWGFFIDGIEAQMPVMVGFVPGIAEDPAPLDQGLEDLGFADPTPDDALDCTVIPRHPEFCPITDEEDFDEDGDTEEILDRFSDPDKLPGENVAFGELSKDYDPANYKWDVNKDGVYNAEDALQISDADGDGIPGTGEGDNEVFGGEYSAPSYAMSRYPLQPFLNEPTTPRLQRNEKIEETIIAKKRGNLHTAEAASHANSGIGSDAASPAEAFAEPETPYAAKYPYNHVKETESGHYEEWDDTPGSERIHVYHRSGTFREYHPDGTLVDKIMKKSFHFVVEDYNFATMSFANFTATSEMRFKASSMNHSTSGSQNRDIGANMNSLVGGNENLRVDGESVTVVAGDKTIYVSGGTILIHSGDGDIHLRGNNILMEAKGTICMKAAAIFEEAPSIVHGPGTVLSNVMHAESAKSSPIGPPVPAAPPPCPLTPSEFDPNGAAAGPASVLPGFLWDDHKGDLWKPVSESTGNLVTLSFSMDQQTLVEALPTGQLETVDIKYLHEDLSITTWTVVRPVHVMGTRVIETGVFSGVANGDRAHYRWKRPGGEYPTQLFLKIGNYGQLVLDSGVRHEAK